MAERNDELVRGLHQQRNELTRHMQAIDDLLTHYTTPEKILIPVSRKVKEQLGVTKRRKKGKRGSGKTAANKKTDLEIAAMGKMFENGVSMRDICKKVNASDATVYKYAKLNNWKRGAR
ncbi:MAG: helix-turn-helix domain-containing protein [bacterium]|nr:helix-turn-helix domain-containing protein [bacterium]